MKPYDIYNLWVLFDKATTDPAFSAEQKFSVGKDMLCCLPPEMLCSGSKPTLEVVREAMEGRLNDIDNERRKSKTGLRAGTSPVAGGPNTDGQTDAGDGVLVEGVASPEEPKKKARKANVRE